ncbi:MAG: hypothetical protein AAGF88_09235 [Pseudomonadota bacterium]
MFQPKRLERWDAGSAPGFQVLGVAFTRDALARFPAHICPPDAHVTTAEFADFVRAPLVWTAERRIIVSPLVHPAFDACDLAAVMCEKGFDGQYLAICNAVADPEVIRADIARIAPNLSFDIVNLDGTRRLRAV